MTPLDVIPAADNSQNKNAKTIEQAILEAIAEARATCEKDGKNSPNCAVAWDIVEELQAKKAHQEQAKKRKTALEEYCETHPDALECLVYDV